ncbi:tetratricopeptide repeat protein [Oleiharenicola lentus]|nr:tetratricopeptide repeat protein [Oleiharenicola lentus]
MLRPLLLSALTVLAVHAGEPSVREQVGELFQQRRWHDARLVLEGITAREPANAEAWQALGQANLALQNADAAVAAQEKAVELLPHDAVYRLQLGHAYGFAATKAGLFAKLGFAKKCKAAYDRAVELDPTNLNARWSLMEFCRQAPGIVGGGIELAYAQAAEIKKLDVRRGRAAYASLYSHEKKFTEAIALYDEVLRETPGDPDALYHFGRLAAQTGLQLDRGLAALREIVAQPDRKNDARVHTFIGDILLKKGDKPGAITAYETALTGDPGYTRALEALRKLKEG